MTDTSDSKRSFFVSYKADLAWVEWVGARSRPAIRSCSMSGLHGQLRGREAGRAYGRPFCPTTILFTLGEWTARYARDPATREDRLIPVVVGPVSQANLLDPILHADLSPHAAPWYHRLIRHLA